MQGVAYLTNMCVSYFACIASGRFTFLRNNDSRFPGFFNSPKLCGRKYRIFVSVETRHIYRKHFVNE